MKYLEEVSIGDLSDVEVVGLVVLMHPFGQGAEGRIVRVLEVLDDLRDCPCGVDILVGH